MNSKFHAAAFAFLALCASPAHASNAVFSKDASHVYLIDYDQKPEAWHPVLIDVDIAKKNRTPIDLSASLGKEAVIQDMSLMPDGRIAVITKTQLWLCDIEKKNCAKFFHSEKGKVFYGVACDWTDGSFLLCVQKSPGSDWKDSGAGSAVWLSKDGKKSMPVGMRRIDAMYAATFDSKGTLFFESYGDLWQGKLAHNDDGDYHTLDLEAQRCAPLATLETQNTTPDSMGVQTIAPAGEWLYAHVYRMGGSGFGNVIRLKVRATTNTGEDLAERLKVYGDAISSVQILEDDGMDSFLCASGDGKRVFYTEGNDPDTAILVENGGKPAYIFEQGDVPVYK